MSEVLKRLLTWHNKRAKLSSVILVLGHLSLCFTFRMTRDWRTVTKEKQRRRKKSEGRRNVLVAKQDT